MFGAVDWLGTRGLGYIFRGHVQWSSLPAPAEGGKRDCDQQGCDGIAHDIGPAWIGANYTAR